MPSLHSIFPSQSFFSNNCAFHYHSIIISQPFFSYNCALKLHCIIPSQSFFSYLYIVQFLHVVNPSFPTVPALHIIPSQSLFSHNCTFTTCIINEVNPSNPICAFKLPSCLIPSPNQSLLSHNCA